MCMGECVESVAGVTDVQKEVVIVGQLTAPTERALLALTDWQVLTQEGLYSKGAGLTKALEIPNTLLILQMILSWAEMPDVVVERLCSLSVCNEPSNHLPWPKQAEQQAHLTILSCSDQVSS